MPDRPVEEIRLEIAGERQGARQRPKRAARRGAHSRARRRWHHNRGCAAHPREALAVWTQAPLEASLGSTPPLRHSATPPLRHSATPPPWRADCFSRRFPSVHSNGGRGSVTADDHSRQGGTDWRLVSSWWKRCGPTRPGELRRPAVAGVQPDQGQRPVDQVRSTICLSVVMLQASR
jgi:hypothetical protein